MSAADDARLPAALPEPAAASSRAPSAGALGRIRLRHLRCFVAIAQLGTLRAAAEALSVTQPAVTKTLGELEDLLGARLFVRGRRGALPTAEAALFLPHALASVDALSRAVDSVARGPAEAPLRLGVLPTVAPFLAQALHAFGAVRGPLGVRVHSGRNAQLVASLKARELDAVIGRLSDAEAMASVSFEPLYAEPMLIVLRTAHPLAHGRMPAAADLSACPLVLPLAGTLIRQVADGFMAGRGIVPRAGWVETLDTAFSRALVQGGDHLWFTPAGAVHADLAGRMLARLPEVVVPQESVGLMLRSDTLPAPQLAALLAVLRGMAAARRAENALLAAGAVNT